MRIPGSTGRKALRAKTSTVVAILFLSVVLASVANYWLGIPLPGTSLVTYRRVGPEGGPQVFCAGSSLLGQALVWSRVSGAMDQGIEPWALGGHHRTFGSSGRSRGPLKRAYYDAVNRWLRGRYVVTDYFFSLGQCLETQHMEQVLCLAKQSSVELMTHPTVLAEYRFLQSDECLKWLEQMRRGSSASVIQLFARPIERRTQTRDESYNSATK
jgi:hypothetical protein